MNKSKSRICVVCRDNYEYCNKCSRDSDKPLWMMTFCSDNCKSIYDIESDFEDGLISDIEAKEKLEKLDLSRKEYFNKSYKNSLDKIMKAKRTKKYIKKDATDVAEKDIVIPTNEVEDNVE